MEDNKVQSPVQYPVQAIVSSDKKNWLESCYPPLYYSNRPALVTFTKKQYSI